jgi:hypothetical protein
LSSVTASSAQLEALEGLLQERPIGALTRSQVRGLDLEVEAEVGEQCLAFEETEGREELGSELLEPRPRHPLHGEAEALADRLGQGALAASRRADQRHRGPGAAARAALEPRLELRRAALELGRQRRRRQRAAELGEPLLGVAGP